MDDMISDPADLPKEDGAERDVPMLTIQIGKSRYKVGIHFSETSEETLENKIRKMVIRDVRERLGMF